MESQRGLDTHHEEPPTCILELAQLVEKDFGLEQGFLNNMMLTFYFNGKDQYLPNHQDKAVDYQSKGKVEDKSQIFNLSFGNRFGDATMAASIAAQRFGRVDFHLACTRCGLARYAAGSAVCVAIGGRMPLVWPVTLGGLHGRRSRGWRPQTTATSRR